MSGTYTRVSQAVAEVLGQDSTEAARVTQAVIEAASGGLGHARISQVVLETLGRGNPDAMRVSQAVIEAVTAALGYVRISQAAAEAVIATLGFVRITQCVLEALVANKELPMPLIYPTLLGLGYSVIKRPMWNTVVGQAASGRDARIGLQSAPIYEFDLTYDLLSDGATNINSTYASDLKTLMGFYNAVNGGVYSFLFTDPDDYSVTGQAIGTGDGTTTAFTLQRTFGGGDGSTTEPIGYLNQTVAPLIYLNGVLQSPSSYTFVTTNNYAQTINFTAAPASGVVITGSFQFYYAVRFKDDQYDFEKIMNQIWTLKKITLRMAKT